ncbi:MAG: hypothetical protein JWO31_2552, partial [Phycisphaerales bacterium]|nr:hypothetical protein [Phycisphaerales bacterium]
MRKTHQTAVAAALLAALGLTASAGGGHAHDHPADPPAAP